MRLKRDALIESALTALVSALAHVLIPLEVTPSRLSQIARISFVKACSTQARKRTSGKPHLAQIAAVTGLSRVEVKKIVASNFQLGKPSSENAPRSQRVLRAWHNNSPYTVRGRPASLRIEGDPPSFRALCKQYSGDIPHKVILSELEKTGRVTVNKERTRVSVSKTTLRDKRLRSAEVTLEFAAEFLSQALNEDSQVLMRKQKVQFSQSISPVYAERAMAGRVNELLDQAPFMFPRKRAGRASQMQLFALIARKRQTKTR
jgi:hypothetical protein